MAWIAITAAFVKTRMAGDEYDQITTAARAAGQTTLVNDIISKTVQEWRGKLRKYHTLESGETVPQEVEIHVLAMIRYRLITRLPGLDMLLDENRKDEWEKANYAINHLNDYEFEEAETIEDAAAGSLPRSDERTLDFTREGQDGI